MNYVAEINVPKLKVEHWIQLIYLAYDLNLQQQNANNF